MTSILGSDDPVFYQEAQEEEAARDLQIRFDDSHNKDGSVNCVGCERPFDPKTMNDYEEDGYIWKECGVCSGVGYSEKMGAY